MTLRKIILTAGLMAAAAPVHSQQALGRLFFTDDQRAALDARRKARLPDRATAEPLVTSPTTRLDGFVKRSEGPSTVWVNGQQMPDDVRPGERSVQVPVGEGRARVELKPGQVLDRSSGEVKDVIGDGEIRIRRAPR